MTLVHLFLLLSLMSGTIFSATADGDTPDSDDESLSTSAIIESVNANITTRRGGIQLVDGDIAVSRTRNASPCTRRGCKWPKSWWWRKVVVPVIISSSYSPAERRTIIRSLVSFHRSTCIRFVWRRSYHRHYLHFFSGRGCWSYIGRQRRGQLVSIQKRGCVSLGTIQHEVLHALGFHHEQARSDRDNHVNIIRQNILPGRESNFRKVATNNLFTPYDYNSIMHYGRFAFSKRRGVLPTIVPKPNPNARIGLARQMSRNDIRRVNRLYRC